MKSLKYLSVLIFLTISSKSHSQPWCLELPATLEEIEACNEYIAKTFAPNLGQWVSDCFDVAAGSDSDRILRACLGFGYLAQNGSHRHMRFFQSRSPTMFLQKPKN